jgi:beta-lactam-binding protein with PASTA domain
MLKVASLVGCEFSLAEKIAEREGLELGTNSKEGMIIWQYPPPHRNIPGSEKVIVLVREKDDDPASMVDLTGVSMRTAIAVMDYQGVEYSIEGSGRVVRQYPAAGTDLKKNTRCRIICDRG